MIRTQVQLTSAQMRQLKRLAQTDGISVAEAVRRCVDRAFNEAAPERVRRYQHARALIGAFADRARAKDLARNHDSYLEDAFR